jgi:hypothetical protein
MINVHNSSTSTLERGARMLGSVPAISPVMAASIDGRASNQPRSHTARLDRIFGWALIVVTPTLFWVAVISALASWRSVELSAGLLAMIIMTMAAFLTIIWASLTIERPTPNRQL